MRYDSALHVHFEHLAENVTELNKMAPQNEVLFMIKANAYGNGLTEIYQYAFNELGINSFGVASLGEALEIRHQFPKDKSEIYIFSDLNLKEEYANLYFEMKLIPVISNMDDLTYFMNKLRDVPLVLKFNTGMNRLGLNTENLEEVIELVKKNSVPLHHLMTHFSSSYFGVERVQATKQQYSLFKKIKKQFLASGIEIHNTSCANSGAIEQKFSLEENFIRPGLMLYGPHSVGSFKGDEQTWFGKNINSLQTHIIQIRELKKGTPVGYGGSVLDKDYQVIFLPLGYGDGLLTYYAGAQLNIEGVKAKILGRVNMDMLALGVPLENKSFKSQQLIKLWGFEHESIMDFSMAVKTIPYQVMCAISPRIPRLYR